MPFCMDIADFLAAPFIITVFLFFCYWFARVRRRTFRKKGPAIRPFLLYFLLLCSFLKSGNPFLHLCHLTLQVIQANLKDFFFIFYL